MRFHLYPFPITSNQSEDIMGIDKSLVTRRNIRVRIGTGESVVKNEAMMQASLMEDGVADKTSILSPSILWKCGRYPRLNQSCRIFNCKVGERPLMTSRDNRPPARVSCQHISPLFSIRSTMMTDSSWTVLATVYWRLQIKRHLLIR